MTEPELNLNSGQNTYTIQSYSQFTERDQEQRTAPRRSEVGVVPEVTWNVGGALRSLGHVGGALRSLGHVGGAQFSRAACDRSAINGERAEA